MILFRDSTTVIIGSDSSPVSVRIISITCYPIQQNQNPRPPHAKPYAHASTGEPEASISPDKQHGTCPSIQHTQTCLTTAYNLYRNQSRETLKLESDLPTARSPTCLLHVKCWVSKLFGSVNNGESGANFATGTLCPADHDHGLGLRECPARQFGSPHSNGISCARSTGKPSVSTNLQIGFKRISTA